MNYSNKTYSEIKSILKQNSTALQYYVDLNGNYVVFTQVTSPNAIQTQYQCIIYTQLVLPLNVDPVANAENLVDFEANYLNVLTQTPPNLTTINPVNPLQVLLSGVGVIVGATGPAGPTGPAGAPQGSPGVTGPQGPQGPAGAQGAPGPQGYQGAQGSPGVTGATGPQGSQGIQGIQGPQGPTGPQGSIGPQGSTGPQGNHGSPGVTGATGPVGAITKSWGYLTNGSIGYTLPFVSAGISGGLPYGSINNQIFGLTGKAWSPIGSGSNLSVSNTGFTVINAGTYNIGFQIVGQATCISQWSYQILKNGNPIPGYTGYIKNSIYDYDVSVTVNNNIITDAVANDTFSLAFFAPYQQIDSGASYISFEQSQAYFEMFEIGGIQGVTGIAGPQGIQGVPGNQGPTGSQGIQGSPGVTGPAGAPQGSPGITGATGPQGIQGSPGVTGPQGSPGVIGPQGNQGSPGVTGATGLQGPQGATGVQGATGPAGNTGPAGPQGATGVQGATGPAGSQGSPGATGTTYYPATTWGQGAGAKPIATLTASGTFYAFGVSGAPWTATGTNITAGATGFVVTASGTYKANLSSSFQGSPGVQYNFAVYKNNAPIGATGMSGYIFSTAAIPSGTTDISGSVIFTANPNDTVNAFVSAGINSNPTWIESALIVHPLIGAQGPQGATGPQGPSIPVGFQTYLVAQSTTTTTLNTSNTQGCLVVPSTTMTINGASVFLSTAGIGSIQVAIYFASGTTLTLIEASSACPTSSSGIVGGGQGLGYLVFSTLTLNANTQYYVIASCSSSASCVVGSASSYSAYTPKWTSSYAGSWPGTLTLSSAASNTIWISLFSNAS